MLSTQKNMYRILLAVLVLLTTTALRAAAPSTPEKPASSEATEILGRWEGTAPDGSKIGYLFSKDGQVTWTIGAQKPIQGRYEAKKKADLVELDIFDFDLPQLNGFRFLGIAQVKGDTMKFFGVPTRQGKNRDGSPATHPKEFPGDAITFAKVQ
jgi:hypothetical protein